MTYVYDDGGRKAAGRKGHTGDCVCRAIAIASGLPYEDVYRVLADGMGSQRKTSRSPKQKRSASDGVSVGRKWFKDYMTSLGARWISTMGIGTGCTVHVRKDELPSGRLVLSLSGHYAAFIDGVLHDTSDCSRDGTRCVYGYWVFG